MIGIIFNPHSRKGASKDKIDGLLSVLDSRHIAYDFRISNHPGESIDLARELADTCDTIVAAGGDGTVFEIVNGSIESDVSYAIFPCGTGNDIARSIYNCEPTPEQMADILVGNNTRMMDCYKVNDEYISVQFTSFGCVAIIVENVEKSKKVTKTLYARSILKSFFKHRSKMYTIIDEDGEKRYFADFISVQNVATAGGGVVVNKDTKIDDGYLDFVLVERKNYIRVIKNGLALIKGRVSEQPNVITKKVKCIEIRADEEQVCCIDGELYRLDHVKAQLYPKQIRFKC